ncbi:MAG TPA: coniferyl-alcohol dehydrogenase [Myxococcota bacterium]|nr:coniferyl-alcohol dehydrogenase [Myxococcota bacterium]
MRDILGYQGKCVVVTGAASGMGAAAARTLVELGAEVHALDVKPVEAPVKQSIACDLSQQASIDAAVEKLPSSVDRLFHCAGLPGPPFSLLDTTLVNFVGLRHLNERLAPRIPEGGAIAAITSVAGMGWAKNLDNVKALVATPDFRSARAWLEAHPNENNGYLFSKQCIVYYTKAKALELVARKVRMNCLSPAPTDTPMLPTFHQQATKDFIETHFLAPIGRNATPEEMAEPLILLNSDAARFVSGVNLMVDYGYVASVEIGARPALL